MQDSNIKAFFNPALKMGNVVSSTETKKLGVIVAVQSNDDGLLYGGIRFDGVRFICREDQVSVEAESIEAYIADKINPQGLETRSAAQAMRDAGGGILT